MITPIQNTCNTNNTIKTNSTTKSTDTNNPRKNLSSAKTNINGKIDDFNQGEIGDCYLLNELKSISRKSWGKALINNTIKPDGMGGAYIRFEGGRTNQKVFHITVEDIVNTRKNNNSYSYGDDDVLAVELAFEKYLKQLGYKNIDGDRGIGAKKDAPRQYFHYICVNADMDIVKLLSGKRGNFALSMDPNTTDLIFNKIKNDMNNYVTTIVFKKDNKLGLQHSHAYEVLSIEKDKRNHPIITLVNPWDTSKKIKMNYYDILAASERAIARENPNRPTNIFKSDDITSSTYTMDKSTTKFDFIRKKYHEEHKKCIKELNSKKDQNNGNPDFKKLSIVINNKNKPERLKQLNSFLNSSDEQKINQLLREKSTDIINEIDQAEYGLGRGKDKKELIRVLINYISKQCQKKGIDQNTINSFRKNCLKELDAILYTNEKTIIYEINRMLDKIDNPQDNTKKFVIKIESVNKIYN